MSSLERLFYERMEEDEYQYQGLYEEYQFQNSRVDTEYFSISTSDYSLERAEHKITLGW